MNIQPITTEEISDAWSEAQDKLDRIIASEGDADGARREDWYFVEILREVILTKRQSADINKKGHQALARCPIHGNFSRLTLPASPTFFDL